MAYNLEFSNYQNPLDNPRIHPNTVIYHFEDCLKDIVAHRKEYVVNPDKDFTRNRVLTIPTLMKMIIFCSGRSSQKEIFEYFSGDLQDQCITNAAFCQQRQKLTPKAFQTLFYELNRPFIKHLKTMHDYLVLAFDGTDLEIPDFTPNSEKDQKGKSHGKSNHSQSEKNTALIFETKEKTRGQMGQAAQRKAKKRQKALQQAKQAQKEKQEEKPSKKRYHISCLYDCINNLYLSFLLGSPDKKEEKDILKYMVEQGNYPKKSIILCDGELDSWDLFAAYLQKDQKFVHKIKEIPASIAQANHLVLEPGKEMDVLLELNPELLESYIGQTQTEPESKRGQSEQEAERDQKQELERESKSKEGEEKEKDKTDSEALQLRLVQIRVSEDTYALLLTNLPQEEFDLKEIKILYKMRWSVETSFRSLKYHSELIFFNSKKEGLIHQEIISSFIKFNLTSLLCLSQQIEQRGSKYELGISFSDAICNVRLCLVGRITIDTLCLRLQKNLIPKRPGRKYKRDVKEQGSKPLFYKPC